VAFCVSSANKRRGLLDEIMTKLSVLLIFAETNGFLTPDEVCRKLQSGPDRRCMYSYLARLRRQGLLERGPNPRRGRLRYRLTQRGTERIAYFKARKR
jgi:DNA-binding IclR family transcriptional regulator